MTPIHRIALLAATVVLAVAMGAPAQPTAPREHPAYLHALSNLRYARALLERPDGGALHEQEREARHDLDKAIDEIKRAAINDGKNLNEHPPVERTLPWAGRLHKALELIDAAHNDVAREEDDPRSQGLQARAIAHIDRARAHVKEAIEIVR
jgi:hypothetical protein